MLTKIILENFQSIGERAEIPIRPLTLIYGPNSAGKSALFDGIELLSKYLDPLSREEVFDLHDRWARSSKGTDPMLRLTTVGCQVVLEPSPFTPHTFKHLRNNYLSNPSSLIAVADQVNPNTKVDIELTLSCFGLHHFSVHINDQPALEIIPGEDQRNQSRKIIFHQINGYFPWSTWRFNRAAEGYQQELKKDPFLETQLLALKRTEPTPRPITIVGHAPWKPTNLWDLVKGFECSLIDRHVLQSVKDLILNVCAHTKSHLPPSASRIHGSRTVPADINASQCLPGNHIQVMAPEDVFPQLLRDWPGTGFSTRALNQMWEEAFRTSDPTLTQIAKLIYEGLAFDEAREVLSQEFEDYDEIIVNDTSASEFQGIEKINDDLNFLFGGQSTKYEVGFTKEILGVDSDDAPQTIHPAVITIELLVNGERRSLQDLGSGVGYSLPAIVTLNNARGLRMIEQPELHLHPALQSRWADLVLQTEAARGLVDRIRNTCTMIESHSEHQLIRILKRLRKASRLDGTHPSGLMIYTRGYGSDFQIRDKFTGENADNICILYFKPTEDGTVPRRIEVSESGRLLDHWPGGFFEEGLEDYFDE